VLPGEGLLESELKGLGFAVHHLSFPRVRALAGVAGAVLKLKEIARTEKASIIHSNSIRTHIYGIITAKAIRAKAVWHERNLITTERIDPDRVLSFLPDAIICNSQAIAKRFASNGRLPGKLSVIHNGVDLDLFNPGIKGDDFRKRLGIGLEDVVVGIASRFNPEKGHEYFLDAAGIITKKNGVKKNKVVFLIAGGAVFAVDKEREKHIREIADKMGIKNETVFSGVCRDMPEAYGAMDIVVLASTAEPCGRVVSEAMAMGKPVIGTDTGGTPEMIEDGVTGILVPPGDPATLASAMEALIADKDKRISMGRAGRKKAQDLFDIKDSAAKTEYLYRRLLDKDLSQKT